MVGAGRVPAGQGATALGEARPGGARQGSFDMETSPMPEDERHRPFSVTIETTLLIERIKKMQPNEILTYQECNSLIDQDVQAEARHILQSARRICQREYQVVTDAERNVGIRRLTDIEITNSGLRTFSGLRRMAKRGMNRITSVSDFDALPDAEKVRHNANLSALALVRLVTRPKSVDRLMGAVNTSITGSLPIARTLELFRGPRKVDK